MEQSHANDSMPSVVNYNTSIGLIGEVVSYGSQTQQNIVCACVENKGENCSICVSAEEIHEQPAGKNLALGANKSSTFVCGFCSQTVSYAKQNHFDPQCYPCNQSFRCQGLLQRHMQKETVYCMNKTAWQQRHHHAREHQPELNIHRPVLRPTAKLAPLQSTTQSERRPEQRFPRAAAAPVPTATHLKRALALTIFPTLKSNGQRERAHPDRRAVDASAGVELPEVCISY
jgi:hypothetical protein